MAIQFFRVLSDCSDGTALVPVHRVLDIDHYDGGAGELDHLKVHARMRLAPTFNREAYLKEARDGVCEVVDHLDLHLPMGEIEMRIRDADPICNLVPHTEEKE